MIGAGKKEMKVVTYNVYGGKYMQERKGHLRKLILEEDADILFLQEARPKFVKTLLVNDSKQPIYEVCMTTTSALVESRKLKRTEKRFLRHTGSMAILLKVGMFEIVEQRLVHEGMQIDTGILFAKLQPRAGRISIAEFETIYLYNIHFAGGTYGKTAERVNKIKQERVKEYDALCEDLARLLENLKASSNYSVMIAGDFNSDVDRREEFPEVESSPELVFNFENNQASFVDLWQRFGGDKFGYTESTSKNRFRAYLKPKQQKEVRFDRIILGQPIEKQTIEAKIKLIGDAQVDDVKSKTKRKERVPLFPSDHFGIAVELE